MKRKITKRHLTLSAGSFATFHLFASWNDWYRSSMAWVDIPIHFLGGVLMAAIFYWFFHKHPNYFDVDRNFWVTLAFVMGWVALTGVAWEFTEYLNDILVNSYNFSLNILQFGLKDTLGDLLSDLTGGLALTVLMRLKYHK